MFFPYKELSLLLLLLLLVNTTFLRFFRHIVWDRPLMNVEKSYSTSFVIGYKNSSIVLNVIRLCVRTMLLNSALVTKITQLDLST